MTYSKENILSAFEATGISPLNERHVLAPEEKLHRTAATTTTAIKKQEFLIPKTPKHGHSIFMAERHLLPYQNPPPKAATIMS